MGLHGDPSKLIHDYYDADYGLAFYGLASLHSSYAVRHPSWQIPLCYLCDYFVSADNSTWKIIPRDAFHRRIFFQPLGIAFTLDTGTMDSLTVNLKVKTVELVLTAVPTSSLFSIFRLRIEHQYRYNITVTSSPNPPVIREAYEIPIKPFPQTTTVLFKWD